MKRETTKKSRKKTILIIMIILTFVITIPLIWSNIYIQTEKITYSSSEIPDAFDGVKIAHLSDYHNHGGKFDDYLIEKIKSEEPDYIFLTGDQTDRFLTNTEKTGAFFSKITEIAPCYMVWGNHDKELPESDFSIEKKYASDTGITVLDDEYTKIERDGQVITVTGSFSDLSGKSLGRNDEDGFNIRLHHFPENFAEIVDSSKQDGHQADLVFCGHAHGGLIRLPFIKGLYAPGQGFLPKYTSGMYKYDGSSMIVSRGLGNSFTTLRLYDPFHLVICTLRTENDK